MSMNFLELCPLVVHLIQCKLSPLRYSCEANSLIKIRVMTIPVVYLTMYCTKAIEQNAFPHANTNIIY